MAKVIHLWVSDRLERPRAIQADKRPPFGRVYEIRGARTANEAREVFTRASEPETPLGPDASREEVFADAELRLARAAVRLVMEVDDGH